MQRLPHPHSLIQRAFIRKAETTTTLTTDARRVPTTTSLNPLASINSVISAALDPAPTTSTTTTSRDSRTTSSTLPTSTRIPRTTTTSSIASIDPVAATDNTLVQATTTPTTTSTNRNVPTTSVSRISSTGLVGGQIRSSITSNSKSPAPSSTNLSANSSNQQSSKTSNHNTVTIVVIVIVVILVLLLAIAGFFGYKHYKKKKEFARDEADGIVGNSAFRKEGEDNEDFGNTSGAIGRNGSYSRNNAGNNEKFYNSTGGYGALAGESPGPLTSYNNNSQYATSSPYAEEAGFAGRGTRSAGESNQFIQVSSPNGITPAFISSPTHSASNYGANQQYQRNPVYTQSPYTSTRQAPIDHLPFSPAYSGSSRYPQSYPPNSSAGSHTNLIQDQQHQQQYRNQVGGVAYNDNHQDEEDVASEIGSAALRSNENFEEEDDRQPLETIHEGDASSENFIPGPFVESENQGKIFTVKRTFEPSMPDELIIFPGDKVMLLVRYDDGWALGENRSHSSEKKGPLRGVFPYDCLESSSPLPASSLPPSIPSSQLEVPHLGRPLSPQSNLDNNFSAPQLAPIRHDSPLGLPGGFARAQNSSSQVPEQTYQYQPTHSHQASLVNGFPDTPLSPAESDILGHYDRPLTTYGNQEEGGMIPIGNRSGEKSKRSSSLKASQDHADLFVALGGVLDDNEERDEKAKLS